MFFHSALRKLVYIDKVKSDIVRQVQVQTASRKILFFLRLNADEKNPFFKTRDLYNFKAKMRREKLGPLISVQALMKHLDEKDWEFSYQQDNIEQLNFC